MNITAKTNICMVIGDPVEHSLSPRMHNAGYEALHVDDQYVYVGCRVESKQIEDFIKGVRAMRIRGVSCTIPHKQVVLPYLDEIDPIAQKIGAVNTIVNENGKLIGYNTDWLGFLTPLKQLTNLKKKYVALLGAGGAARAIAYAVTNEGAHLSIFNRTMEKAKELAEDFGAQPYPIEQIEEVKKADIIVNTTSIGLHPHEKETPLPKEFISSNQIVYDLVYTQGGTTRLLSEAQEKNAKTIPGIEMLLHQGFAQFKLFTGFDAPEEEIRKAII